MTDLMKEILEKNMKNFNDAAVFFNFRTHKYEYVHPIPVPPDDGPVQMLKRTNFAGDVKYSPDEEDYS